MNRERGIPARRAILGAALFGIPVEQPRTSLDAHEEKKA
jgi:hypothetical protein